MFPTPEQNARLKACRSPDEYDREWERVTEENIKTMEAQAAAELRAIREQQSDFYWYDDLKKTRDSADTKLIPYYNGDTITKSDIEEMVTQSVIQGKIDSTRPKMHEDDKASVIILGFLFGITFLIYKIVTHK